MQLAGGASAQHPHPPNLLLTEHCTLEERPYLQPEKSYNNLYFQDIKSIDWPWIFFKNDC